VSVTRGAATGRRIRGSMTPVFARAHFDGNGAWVAAAMCGFCGAGNETVTDGERSAGFCRRLRRRRPRTARTQTSTPAKTPTTTRPTTRTGRRQPASAPETPAVAQQEERPKARSADGGGGARKEPTRPTTTAEYTPTRPGGCSVGTRTGSADGYGQQAFLLRRRALPEVFYGTERDGRSSARATRK